MKITSISLENYGNTPSGRINLYDENNTVSINITKDEAAQIFALAARIFEARQPEIAKSVADMKVPALIDLTAERSEA